MNEYRQRALKRVNSTNNNVANTTSTYRQRALNRQQAKGEEMAETKLETNAYLDTKPITAEAVVGANAATNGVDPQEASKVLNDLIKAAESRVVKADSLADYSKKLSPERIQEIKETSAILNPEKYHKNVDAGYYARRAVEGFGSVGEKFADTMTRAREHVSYPVLKAGEFVTSLGGKYDNRLSDAFGKLLERNKEASIEALESTPVENYAKKTEFIYNDINGLQKLAGDVVSGVAAMAPSLAANAVIPGSGYAILGAQGYGGGIQQAYQKTGELGLKEDMYGLLSGLSEVAIEKISGGIGGLGNGAIDNIASKIIKNGLIRSATGEGIEEAVSTFIDPYLQRLTYDKGAEGAKASEVLRSAIVGSLTSMLLQGGAAAVNLPQAIQQNKENRAELRNSLEGLDKMLPTYENVSETVSTEKNVASELPTMASQQAMLPTNQTEGKTAQNGNTEQMVKNIENNNILEYNNNRGVENGEKINGERYTSEVRDGLHEESAQENRQYNTTEYEQWEQSLKPIPRERLTTEEIADIDNAQKEYGKTVNLIDENENSNKYSGGASLTKKGQLNISRQQAEYFGLKNMIEHEVVEDDILYDDVANDILTPAIELIMKDTKFDDQKKAFWKGQTDNIPTDELIAKDILCDRFAEIKNNTKMKYDNVLSPDVNTTVDMALQNYYKQVYGKELNIKNDAADTQSAFSMPKNYIDPTQDIQKATEFISKATVEDIDTLNKMAEEAEKHPDRVDLQFFAEKVREAIEKLSRQQVRQAIMEETGVEEYNLDDVNKISKAKMNFTTPVRVIEKIFNKETANKINDNFFKPIKHNEAERIRRLNKERNDIKELDIKPGSAEDAAIQKYGEGEYVDENGATIPYTLENLKRDFPDTWQKLQNATNVIRSKYDTYLEEINEVLKDNGYDPIPKRKDYFRHFEELNDLFSILGVPTKVDDIPTDLNGMTADLKPGKQFFANALQRKGNKTTYSAVKGIDGYLDGAMNILYHTKDIQKLRTLDKYIRDTYGASKGLSEASTMTEEQKAKRVNQINEGHLSEFAAWLTEYTNALAGKKSRLDRGIEEMFGRKAYKYLNLIKKQVGANMTGLNVNSALSNFISVTQAAPKTNKKALVKGTIDTVKNIFKNDGFIDKSDFLTTRFGTDKLAKNWWQKAGDVGQIFMSATDYFTANLITRSKYQEFLDKGYTESEAIKKADEFADRLMAGRGKGDLPNAFESKMLGIVTQFQLEVTNQLDSIFYDTLHEDYSAESTSKLAKEHPKFYNAASATFILGQIFALAFLYNEGKEKLTGTEGGALDPIGTIADAMKHLTDENLSKPEAIAMIVEDIANQLPFASIITGGGRLPIKEAFPDLLSVAKGEAKLGDEMWNLTNLLLPTGGGQIKKTAQGLSTFAKGGSYSKDAEGKDKLKYPVEQNAINLIKSVMFGKWATPGAKDYIERGFKALSANQTEGYKKAMEAGITSEQFYDAYDAQRGIKGLGDLTSPYKKTKIDEVTKGLNKKQKTILYDTFDISKEAQKSSKKVTDKEAEKQKEKLEKEKQLKAMNVKFNK